MFSLIPTMLLIILVIAVILMLERASSIMESRSIHDLLQGSGNFFVLNTKQLLGTMTLSLSALYFFTDSFINKYFIGWHWDKDWAVINISLASIAVFIGYKTAATIETKSRLRNPYHITYYFILRISYLVLYEFFFRCILLLFLLQTCGWFLAILINTFLYTLAHLYSGKKEMMGAIFFGALLCFISLAQQTIWPALIIHLLLALSHELRLVFYQRVFVQSKWKTLFNN